MFASGVRGSVAVKKASESRTARYSIVLAVVALLTIANGFVLRVFDVVGVPGIFGLVLLAQVLLLVLFLYSLGVVLRTPLRIAWSILVSALRGIQQNDYVQGVLRRFPSLVPWLEARFSRDRASGLLLTLSVGAASVFGVLFWNVTLAVLSHGIYAGVDQRVVNLMPNIRTSAESSFLAFFTFAASYLGIVFLIVALAVVGGARRQWWLPVLFVAALALEVIFSEGGKNIVRRTRPEVALRQLAVSGFSFPSGHTLAATVIFGLVAYLLFRCVRAHILRLFIILLGVVMIVLVGVSRVYFAVHYPTDVLGGFLLGGFVLTVLIAVVEANQRFHTVKWVRFGPRLLGTLTIVVTAVLVFDGVLSGPLTPLHTMTVTASPTRLSAITPSSSRLLPRYSETLTGARMEPINFIFVGSRQQIEHAFGKAGWYEADPPTLGNTLHELLAAAKNEQYLTAPVTPSYLDAKPQTIAFEKPTRSNTLQQRHHTRIWELDYEVAGRPVWVATASLDRGIGIGSKIALPTHHIDPNVDSERAYITKSLNVTSPTLIDIVGPQLGHNASGDPFFTDGQAVVIRF